MPKINYYDRVRLRTLNEIEDPDDSDLTIQIVPAYEADATAGRISVDAPVGKAVFHRRIGDIVTVRAQGKAIPMRIVTVDKHKAIA